MRIGLRLAAGFALYFALNALWLLAGLDRLYDRAIERLGAAIVPFFAHFPLASPTIEPLAVHNPGHVHVLTLALALVVGRLSWRERVLRYGGISLLLTATHVLAMALQLNLALALRFQQNSGLALLVPWEQELLRRLFKVLFVAGLQVVPFVTIVLTAYWSAGRLPGGSFGGRGLPPALRRRRILIAVALALALTVFAAQRVRETDARHLHAHVVVGAALLDRRQVEAAERQFRAAIRGDTSDARAWLGLAAIVRQRGERDEAIELLRRALDVVEEPAGRDRLRQRLEDDLRDGTRGR